jgi:hypothetical protein
MSHSCAQWRGEIGAYIVGALDGCARDLVTRHLAACAGCRADYAELVPVRYWLGLLALPADQLVRPLHDSLQEAPISAASSTPRIGHPVPGAADGQAAEQHAAAKDEGGPAELVPVGRTGLVKCH